jgi:hypothetical protein
MKRVESSGSNPNDDTLTSFAMTTAETAPANAKHKHLMNLFLFFSWGGKTSRHRVFTYFCLFI